RRDRRVYFGRAELPIFPVVQQLRGGLFDSANRCACRNSLPKFCDELLQGCIDYLARHNQPYGWCVPGTPGRCWRCRSLCPHCATRNTGGEPCLQDGVNGVSVENDGGMTLSKKLQRSILFPTTLKHDDQPALRATECDIDKAHTFCAGDEVG